MFYRIDAEHPDGRDAGACTQFADSLAVAHVRAAAFVGWYVDVYPICDERERALLDSLDDSGRVALLQRNHANADLERVVELLSTRPVGTFADLAARFETVDGFESFVAVD